MSSERYICNACDAVNDVNDWVEYVEPDVNWKGWQCPALGCNKIDDWSEVDYDWCLEQLREMTKWWSKHTSLGCSFHPNDAKTQHRRLSAIQDFFEEHQE